MKKQKNKQIGTMVRVNEPGNEIDGRTGRLEYVEGKEGFVLYAGQVHRVKRSSVTAKEVVQTHRPEPTYAESQYQGMDYEDDEKITVDLNFERWMK